MSHFSRIKTSFVEEKYIINAIKALGYEYEVGKQKITGFGGQKIDVDIKIKIRLSYDIGLQKMRDGKYQIVTDWQGVRVKSKKDFVDKLSQQYAYHATLDKLTEQGFDMVEEQNEKGQIKLVLRRMV